MKAPSPKLDLKAFNQAFLDYLATRCDRQADNTYRCKKCGAAIQSTTCLATIHDARKEGCHDNREGLITMSLPYCPACEGEPTGDDICTCVHV